MKPDSRIFELACERIGIPVDDAVFIDDLKKNVKAARTLGTTAILFRETKAVMREYDQLLGG